MLSRICCAVRLANPPSITVADRQGSIAITDFSDYTPTSLLTDPAHAGYWAKGDNGPFDAYNPCGKGKACPRRGVILEKNIGCSGTANRTMAEWNFTNQSSQALFLRMVSAIAADPAVDSVRRIFPHCSVGSVSDTCSAAGVL